MSGCFHAGVGRLASKEHFHSFRLRSRSTLVQNLINGSVQIMYLGKVDPAIADYKRYASMSPRATRDSSTLPGLIHDISRVDSILDEDADL